MPNHTVKHGEHLARIAFDAGFTNFKRIFDLPENAPLKSSRKTPHVLARDDSVFLPEPEPRKDETAPTDTLTKFKLDTPPLNLPVAIRDRADAPAKNLKCVLVVEGVSKTQNTDDSGRLTRPIPLNAAIGRLDARDPELGVEIASMILIGGLEPVDTVTGQIARLNNLGYEAGDPRVPPGALPPPDQAPDPDAALRFRSAVEEFQCDHALTVDGKCGQNTQAKLKEAHGC